MTVRIICADVMDGLRQLEDESVHCVVTSPPYWGLRDYGVPGQIGLEPTLGEHIAKMVAVFRGVRRVLRKDGTVWLNYGDCFATSVNGRSAADTKAAGNDDRTFRDKPFSTVGPIYVLNGGQVPDSKNPKAYTHQGRVGAGGVLKPKDLCMIPHRLAIALQEDGWWVRMDNVWAKPNPMPESITDRPTKAHEYVFLLTKAERYYYDGDAIREACSETSHGSPNINVGWKNAAVNDPKGPLGKWTAEDKATGRNKRSVWTIATAPFPEAHFATFPPELPAICIKAGTSEKGCCAKCGAPWAREIEKSGGAIGKSWSNHSDEKTKGHRVDVGVGNLRFADYKVQTKGWFPSCSCNADIVPATVLDCFAGAGTTCLVADRLQRNAIGIELNPEYAAMAEKRVSKDRGGLLDWIEQPEQPKPAKQLDLLEANP